MALIDIIPQSFVTKSVTNNATSGSGSVTGSLSDAYDGDTGTYYQYQIYHGGDGTASGTTTIEATWSVPISVDNVYLYLQQGTYGGNYKASTRTYTIYLYYSGTWNQIDTQTTTDGQGSNVWYYETYEETLDTGWSGVTGLKIYMYGSAYSYEGDRQQYVRHRPCEFEVWTGSIINQYGFII